MPALSPDVLALVLAAGEDVPETGYAPTPDDVRRARERVAFASAIVSAVDGGGETPSLCDAEDTPTIAAIGVARDALRARSDAHSLNIRRARMLLIDAARYLAGAADACPV